MAMQPASPEVVRKMARQSTPAARAPACRAGPGPARSDRAAASEAGSRSRTPRCLLGRHARPSGDLRTSLIAGSAVPGSTSTYVIGTSTSRRAVRAGPSRAMWPLSGWRDDDHLVRRELDHGVPQRQIGLGLAHLAGGVDPLLPQRIHRSLEPSPSFLDLVVHVSGGQVETRGHRAGETIITSARRPGPREISSTSAWRRLPRWRVPQALGTCAGASGAVSRTVATRSRYPWPSGQNMARRLAGRCSTCAPAASRRGRSISSPIDS